MQDRTIGTALASSSPNNGLFELFVFLHCNHRVSRQDGRHTLSLLSRSFSTCWASYVPQSFTDLVVIKTPTLRRISTIFIPVRISTQVILKDLQNYHTSGACLLWWLRYSQNLWDLIQWICYRQWIIPGYSIFCRDREDLGEGVIVAVKGNIQTSRPLDLEREDTELVVVEER